MRCGFSDGCGEGGIRTPDTSFPVCMFSKHVVSATHPLLQWERKCIKYSQNEQ